MRDTVQKMVTFVLYIWNTISVGFLLLVLQKQNCKEWHYANEDEESDIERVDQVYARIFLEEQYTC